MHINYLAIIAATALAFLFSAGYYILLNKKVMELRRTTLDKKVDVRTTMTPNKIIIELVRTFILGIVMAYAVGFLELTQFVQALVVAIWLWVGFPVVLLVGSVIHEHFPPRLAAIHAGDWLAKLVIFAVILTLWR